MSDLDQLENTALWIQRSLDTRSNKDKKTEISYVDVECDPPRVRVVEGSVVFLALVLNDNSNVRGFFVSQIISHQFSFIGQIRGTFVSQIISHQFSFISQIISHQFSFISQIKGFLSVR